MNDEHDELGIWERRELAFAAGVGLLAAPLASLVTGRLHALSWLVIWVSAVLIGAPLLVVALFARGLRDERQRMPSLGFGIRTLAVAELLTQVSAAILGFLTITRPQDSALCLLFTPLLAHLLSFAFAGLAALLTFVLGWLDGRGQRSRLRSVRALHRSGQVRVSAISYGAIDAQPEDAR